MTTNRNGVIQGPLRDLGGQVFNVMGEGFYARGTGVIDDSPYIQDAIDTASAKGGGIVLLPKPPAFFGLKSPLTLSDDIILMGIGAPALLKPIGGFSGNGVVKATGKARVAIKGLKIDGGASSGCHGIRLEGCTDFALADLAIVGATSNGIYVYLSAADFLIDNVDITGSTASGIQCAATIGNAIATGVIRHSRCTANGRGGIDLGSNGRGLVVDGNACADNTTYGIYADGGEDPLNTGIRILNNTVSGSVYGINMTDGRRGSIAHNDVTGCTVGIQAVNCSATLVGFNKAYANAQYGINCDVAGPYTADPPAGTVRDSAPTLYLVRDAAKKAYTTPANNILVGNHVYDNGTAAAGTYDGIRVVNGQDWQFLGNQFYDDQATPTQKRPINALKATAPTFPAWLTATPYTTADVVSDGGAYYQCIVAHTSGAGTEPGVGASWATRWALSPVQPWVTSHAYAATDWARNGGAMYAAKQAHTSGAGTEPGVGVSWATYWTLKAVTLDGFEFVNNFSGGHATSNDFSYAGTNQGVLFQEGMESRFASNAKFLADVAFGVDGWKISPQGSNVVNVGLTGTITSLLGALQVSTSLKVGSGATAILKHLSVTAAWNPASVADGANTSTTVTVTGAALGDTAVAGFSTAVPAGALLAAAVTAADTVTVTLQNHTGAPLDLDAGTLRADVWQH